MSGIFTPRHVFLLEVNDAKLFSHGLLKTIYRGARMGRAKQCQRTDKLTTALQAACMHGAVFFMTVGFSRSQFWALTAWRSTPVVVTVWLCQAAFLAVPFVACMRSAVMRAMFLEFSTSACLTCNMVEAKVETLLLTSLDLNVSRHIAVLDLAFDMNDAEGIFVFDNGSTTIGPAFMLGAAVSLVLARTRAALGLAPMGRTIGVLRRYLSPNAQSKHAFVIKAEFVARISRDGPRYMLEFGVEVLSACLSAALDGASHMNGAYGIMRRLFVVAAFLSRKVDASMQLAIGRHDLRRGY